MCYQCGDLLLARTLCLVYSVCKIGLCICLVVYGSLTMYRSKEQTSDGFPCITLYNTGLFSPCLVIFLVRAFCCSHLYTLVINTPSYNTRCSQAFSNSRRTLASNAFNTRPQCSGIHYHLHYLMI